VVVRLHNGKVERLADTWFIGAQALQSQAIIAQPA
jgi:hypothetical protein